MTCTSRLLFTVAVISLAGGCAPVSDAPALHVLATDPGPEAVLGVQQRFHIKFSLTSKTPLLVTVDPYFEKQPLSANLGTSAPVSLPAGGGSAVAHLFFWGDHATRVDEIRLVARAPKETQSRAEFSLPVKLSWVARDVAPPAPATWVSEASKNDGNGNEKPLSALDERSQWLAFGTVIAAIAIGGFASRWLRRRWRERQSKD
jgi:hypothetical protein